MSPAPPSPSEWLEALPAIDSDFGGGYVIFVGTIHGISNLVFLVSEGRVYSVGNRVNGVLLRYHYSVVTGSFELDNNSTFNTQNYIAQFLSKSGLSFSNSGQNWVLQSINRDFITGKALPI